MAMKKTADSNMFCDFQNLWERAEAKLLHLRLCIPKIMLFNFARAGRKHREAYLLTLTCMAGNGCFIHPRNFQECRRDIGHKHLRSAGHFMAPQQYGSTRLHLPHRTSGRWPRRCQPTAFVCLGIVLHFSHFGLLVGVFMVLFFFLGHDFQVIIF